MPYNPDIHHRRSIRLRNFDYTGPGAYFVTICTWQRECLFGDVVNGKMLLNDYASAVERCWQAIAGHFNQVELDAFVIMPNHIHGIILLQHDERAQHAAPLQMPVSRNVAPGSLGAIVRSFKSAATKLINGIRSNTGCPVWQRNYYERVIRGEAELARAREYIDLNPSKWEEDENHPSPPHPPPTLSSTVISSSAR